MEDIKMVGGGGGCSRADEGSVLRVRRRPRVEVDFA